VRGVEVEDVDAARALDDAGRAVVHTGPWRPSRGLTAADATREARECELRRLHGHASASSTIPAARARSMRGRRMHRCDAHSHSMPCDTGATEVQRGSRGGCGPQDGGRGEDVGIGGAVRRDGEKGPAVDTAVHQISLIPCSKLLNYIYAHNTILATG